MTEERGAVSGMDPAELWRQWMESGSRMWSEMARAPRGSRSTPTAYTAGGCKGCERCRGGWSGLSPSLSLALWGFVTSGSDGSR